MTIGTITITNLHTERLSLDLKFAENVQFRPLLGVGESVEVGDIASVDEVNREPTLLALRTASPPKISITVTGGTDDLPTFPIGDDLVAASAVDQVASTGFGVPTVIYGVFAAGAGGAADDVTITAGAPFAFRIVDVMLEISTAVGGSTCTLRSAVAGGGSALSDALATATTGRKRDTGTVTTWPLVGATGGVYIRRSDSGIAGAYLLTIVKV